METFRAKLFKQDNWFIVQCQEIDLATQAGSETEAAANIKEALALYLEAGENEIDVILDQMAQPLATADSGGRQAERSFRQVRFRLESAGFVGISQRPNHAKFTRNDEAKTRSAILPHYTQLAKAVVASILRQAQLPADDWE